MAREKLTEEEKQELAEQKAEFKEHKKAAKKHRKEIDKQEYAGEREIEPRGLRARRMKKAEKKARKQDERSFNGKTVYDKMKPREGYVFHSDYFIIDDEQYCSILSFFHTEGASDRFPPFWGINMIPRGLENDIVIHRFDQIHPMPQSWVDSQQSKAENIADMSAEEQAKGGTSKERGKSRRRQEDFEVIGQEILSGAAYLDVSFRLMVKAPSLEKLDLAIEHIERVYKDSLGTVSIAAYYGDQRAELETMFLDNDSKPGKHFMFTSDEFAGNYSLVTHGFEDVTGEYVGKMYGDVNSAAILFDCDDYFHHVVVAGSNKARTLSNSRFKNEKGVNLWGSKLSQAALMNNHRVIHFLLDNCNLDALGPDLSPITSKIDLSKGDVNMFEVFGEKRDELSLFAVQLEKIKLMAQELYTDQDNRGTLEGSLSEVLTTFYIDNGMWAENAEAHREDLRLVGIPHVEVPRLREFAAYLAQRYKASTMSKNTDPKILDANRALNFLFRNMLSSNGDIFDSYTTDIIDDAKNGRRVIYDFASLSARGSALIMAQFINIFGFAVGSLTEGDVIIIHGAELISDIVKKYILMQKRSLDAKGVRIVWIYTDVESMLNASDLNKFDEADFTVLGNMSANVAMRYKEMLGQAIPNELLGQIASNSDLSYYIRRDFDNVVFNADLKLGIGR